MFRLLKLAAYGLLGYVLYELFIGLRDGAPSRSPQGGQDGGGGQSRGQEQGQQQQGGNRDLNRALDEDRGRMMNMTGSGRGENIRTEEPSGTSVPHAVGRGVVTP